MRKFFAVLIVTAVAVGCGSAVPSPPATPKAKSHVRRHAKSVAPAPRDVIGERLTFNLPDGWRMMQSYYTTRSASYLAGHFAPQDSQAQIDVAVAKGPLQAQCDEEMAYQRNCGADVAPEPLPGLQDGTCSFSWRNADQNRSGTIMVAVLATTVAPALTMQVSITGLYGHETDLASYAPLIAAAVTAR